MLIAAQAVALDVVLINNKVRELGRIEGLRIQNWAADRAK